MVINDFIYDGTSLSSLGYVICNIDSGNGLDEIENSTKTFSNVSMFGGKFMPFTSVSYDNRLEFTFDICKIPCYEDEYGFYISNDELSYLMRWLSRSSANKFKIIANEFANVYYEGSFNISVIKDGSNIIGLRLTFISTRPFGLREAMMFEQTFDTLDEELVITDISDEEGYIYPHIEIECHEDGNLCLTNSFNGIDTIIDGCVNGEKIIITENLIIGSNIIEHRIQNDFNYDFLRIENTYREKTNRITSTLKCNVKISYCPVRKVVV